MSFVQIKTGLLALPLLCRARHRGLCVALAVTISLAGCSSGSQPFGKPEGTAETANPVVPPKEAFSKAGPGAEKDLDYETIYGPGALPADSTIALESPGTPVDQNGGETLAEAEKTKAPNPQVGTNKAQAHEIKAVAVVQVKGSPGKGNAELTDAMRKTLRSAGWPVLNAPREDALTIAGAVSLAKPKGEAQTVALTWTVTSFDGAVLGTIRQANDVPAGSLDKSWGEAAGYATEAGAAGIFDLIKKYR